MQLKIQRSQRAGTFGAVLFCLDIRSDYSPEERGNINKYKLGGQVIYNSQAARKHLATADVHLDRTQSGSAGERAAGLARGAFSLAMAKMQLNISIASLGRGHHIECKDLEELLEAEDTVRNACKNVTRYLQVADSFNGSEVVIEYVNGEEQVHIMQNAPPMIEYQSSSTTVSPTKAQETSDLSGAAFDVGQWFGKQGRAIKGFWLAFEQKVANWLHETIPVFSTDGYRYLIRAVAVLIVLFLLYQIF